MSEEENAVDTEEEGQKDTASPGLSEARKSALRKRGLRGAFRRKVSKIRAMRTEGEASQEKQEAPAEQASAETPQSVQKEETADPAPEAQEKEPPQEEASEADGITKTVVTAKPRSALSRFRSALSKVKRESTEKKPNEVEKKADALRDTFNQKLSLKNLIKDSLKFGAYQKIVKYMNRPAEDFSAGVAEIVVTVAPRWTPQYGEFRRDHDKMWDKFETDFNKLKGLEEFETKDLSKIRARKVLEGIEAVKNEGQKPQYNLAARTYAVGEGIVSTDFNQTVKTLREKLLKNPYAT